MQDAPCCKQQGRKIPADLWQHSLPSALTGSFQELFASVQARTRTIASINLFHTKSQVLHMRLNMLVYKLMGHQWLFNAGEPAPTSNNLSAKGR
jgi:hypothetical protein